MLKEECYIRSISYHSRRCGCPGCRLKFIKTESTSSIGCFTSQYHPLKSSQNHNRWHWLVTTLAYVLTFFCKYMYVAINTCAWTVRFLQFGGHIGVICGYIYSILLLSLLLYLFGGHRSDKIDHLNPMITYYHSLLAWCACIFQHVFTWKLVLRVI